MATIEPYETSGGKRYQVRYRTPERTQTKKRGFRTKREAEQFAASVEVQKYRGEFISHGLDKQPSESSDQAGWPDSARTSNRRL